MNQEQLQELISASVASARQEFATQLDELTAAISRLQAPRVETYAPVAINPHIDLIKSVAKFNGDSTAYSAWRTAAHFAKNCYTEGSEKYYIAMGIFRNKITGNANATLSAFNTVLNFKAIIARLDQTFSDKRPIHVLENELSILKQNNLSIIDYYDLVDKQLTLIINKQTMTHSANYDLIDALNERPRENALRVFISGLRRPICEFFSHRNQQISLLLWQSHKNSK